MSNRAILRREYRDLVAEVSRILAECDPCGLVGSGAPQDEYDSEAIRLLPAIAAARTPMEVSAEVTRVLGDAFGNGMPSSEVCREVGQRLHSGCHARAARLLLPRRGDCTTGQGAGGDETGSVWT